MSETPQSTDYPQVPCEVCHKHVAPSEAKSMEVQDYVLYFCGLECYEQWQRKKAGKDETPPG